MSEQVKYPWQELVADAFAAPSESLPAKIALAEQAIAARLTDQKRPQPDVFERLSLSDAMKSLGILVDEIRSKLQREKSRQDIA